ncbi:MAG: cytochrome D1 domain-containing protein [Verrucomicrobiota bacterium]|jgi:YVTN family beta-propeller protein
MMKPASLLIASTAALFALGGQTRADGLLVVANKGDQTVGIIDPAAGRQLATVAEDGVTGHELIASPDGRRVFVPIYGDSGVGKAGSDGRLLRVIDLATRQIIGTVDFGKGLRPHCAMIGPKDGLLYVTTELDQSVTIIDPATLKIVGRVPTGQEESHMLAITRDGRRGYTANVGPGTVSVLDLEARKVLAVIPVCKTTQRISLSVDDRWVFTSDQSQPRLAVIDTAKNAIDRWIPMPGTGYGSAPTPDGKWLLVALPRARKVAVVDLRAMTVAQSLDVPASPQETLVRPDGAEAYVSCDASRKVAVIDTKDWTVRKLIDAGPTVDGLAWAPAASAN